MYSASARKFLEQQWRQAMRHNKRTATTFQAQDARMMAGHGRVVREQHARYGENPILRGLENPNSRSPKTGLDNSRNVAGDTNRTASPDSAYLGQADDVRAMRSAYNDAQRRHVRHGSNAGVVNRDSTAPPLERGSPRPGIINQTPPNNPFAATNQRLPGDIPQQHNSASLAQEYHVRKAQIHASLWQQEIRKQAEDLKGNADFVSSMPLHTEPKAESPTIKTGIAWLSLTEERFLAHLNDLQHQFPDFGPAIGFS